MSKTIIYICSDTNNGTASIVIKAPTCKDKEIYEVMLGKKGLKKLNKLLKMN